MTHLCSIINGNEIDPIPIQFVNMCHRGNQCKGKFCFRTKIIVKMSCGEKFEIIYPLADVKCKRDV